MDDPDRVEVSWLSSTQNPGDLASAFDVLAEQLVRIPRLACVLRQVSSERAGVIAALKAAALAQDVYSRVCDQTILLEHIVSEPERCHAKQTPLSSYINYPSVQAFTLAITHALCQMLICGIILA